MPNNTVGMVLLLPIGRCQIPLIPSVVGKEVRPRNRDPDATPATTVGTYYIVHDCGGGQSVISLDDYR